MARLLLNKKRIDLACELRERGGSDGACARHAGVSKSIFSEWLHAGEMLRDHRNHGDFMQPEYYSRWVADARKTLPKLKNEIEANGGKYTREHKLLLELADEMHAATDAYVTECQVTIDSAKKLDAQLAMKELERFNPGEYSETSVARIIADQTGSESSDISNATLDALKIGRAFVDLYRDIIAHGHTEYVLNDGRGSGKSSFVGMIDPLLIVNNPTWHVLCIREHANTLRNSVYAQIQWGIDQLELTEKFKFTTSPLEITYIPTGQKIFFRGANDPMSIKSIKPPFGAIAVLHFEEYDQLAGPETVRSIMQSAIRGTDVAYIFKVFNTPRSMNHWANKEMTMPKDGRYLHKSSYLDMPPEWLGQVFIAEAEYLKKVNPDAYENEYMGAANGTGGMVFPNVELRAITDAEIKLYDNIYEGLDFGYAVDPLHWVRLSYHAGRRELYIYDEFRAVKMGNKELAETLIAQKGCGYSRLIIADSAEPKSIADLNTYGLTVKGAEKPPESVRYSMKWLQNLAKIVIDPERCPYTAQEFTSYEYPRTKDGLVMSIYPDENNHSIDSTRYALNLQWRKAGN